MENKTYEVLWDAAKAGPRRNFKVIDAYFKEKRNSHKQPNFI